MIPNAAWTQKILDLVANDPIPLERAIAEVRNMVPPGRAFRAATLQLERVRAAREARSGKPTKARTVTDDEMIRAGQRAIVMDSVTKLVRRERLLYQDDENGVRWLILGRPQLKGGSLYSPRIQELRTHQADFIKRPLPGLTDFAGHAMFAYDIECSCGWTKSGAEMDEDSVWHVWITSKDEGRKEFTKHRRRAPGYE